MKTFFITSTITIQADSRAKADRRLKQAIYNEGQLSELGFDLLKNAEVNEDIGEDICEGCGKLIWDNESRVGNRHSTCI
jgi:hypothetical protein